MEGAQRKGESLREIIERVASDWDRAAQRVVEDCVMKVSHLRWKVGLGRFYALRIMLDFVTTVKGTPKEQGWWGLQYLCPHCWCLPQNGFWWTRCKNCGNQAIIPQGMHIEQDEEDPRTYRSTGWFCAACGHGGRRPEGARPCCVRTH